MLCSARQLFAQASPVCDVRAAGAKGDGSTLDTAAVSSAIATCSKQGGGTVYFPPGRYVLGTVELKSHIHLLLESGAVLVGSHALADYLPSAPFGFARHYGVDITGEGTVLGMFIARNAEDISIDGQGVIDGQGNTFMAMQTPQASNEIEAQSARNPEAYRTAMRSIEYGPVQPDHRPGTMIVFFHCKDVRLRGVTLRDAPNWTLHLQDVDQAAISGISIVNNPKIPNNDGIDCMQCRYVRISDCSILTGDDDLAIVSSEHVNVSNCSLSSRSAAIRLESTSLSTFTSLSMDTNRGIGIFAGGYDDQQDRPTEDVLFSDIVMRTRLIPGGWWGKAEPIYIAVQPCGAAGLPCSVRVRHVTFNNITAEAEGGVLLWGGEGTSIDDVTLRGVRLHMVAPWPEFSKAVGGNLDLRWTNLDPRSGIVKSDIPAIYARHVTGLRVEDVQVNWAAGLPAYFSDGLRVENFADLSIDDYAGRQASAAGAAISLENGSGVAITNSRALPGTATFVQLNQVQDRRVFANYDVGDAARVIEPNGQVFALQLGAPAAAMPAAHQPH